MSNKIKCPYCQSSINTDKIDLEWHKNGRQGKCGSCNKTVIFTKQARTLKRDPKNNNRLIKKFSFA